MTRSRVQAFWKNPKNRLTVRIAAPLIGVPLAIIFAVGRHAEKVGLAPFSAAFLQSIVNVRFILVLAFSLVLFGWGVSRLVVEVFWQLGLRGGEED